MREAIESLEFVEPWARPANREPLERELKAELSAGHPLYGATVQALAFKFDVDDVLFLIDGTPSRLASVHLTWSGRREADPRWPTTRFFDSVETFREAMLADHQEYVSDPDSGGGAPTRAGS